MSILASCGGSKTTQATDAANLITVQLKPKRSVDILLRDLVTVNSIPTGLKKVEQLSAEKNKWLLSFDADQIDPALLIQAIQAYPNTEKAHLGR